MRAILGFAVLAVGIAAAAATLLPANSWDVSLIEQKASGAAGLTRVAGLSAIGDGVATAPAASQGSVASRTGMPEFQTTMAPSAPRDDASDAVQADVDTPTPAIASGAVLDPQTKAALARDIQLELARLGCYAGPANGQWTAETQRSANLLVSEANAVMPTAEPDFALLSIARAATAEQACGPAVAIAVKPDVVRPAMGLGMGAGDAPKRPAAYHRDREVEALFTNPLGR
jgi:hypothetical protein